MRCFLHTIVAVSAAGLISGCTWSTTSHPKQFPSGEPGSFAELESETEFPSVEQAEIITPRQIIIPSNRREERGVYLDAKLVQTEVQAGTPVVIKCSAKNVTNSPTHVIYPTTLRFDAVAFADPNQRSPVFVWSDTQDDTPFYEERMLGSGVSITRTLEIPTVTIENSGPEVSGNLTTPLTAGSYYLWIRHSGTPALSFGPVEFSVVE